MAARREASGGRWRAGPLLSALAAGLPATAACSASAPDETAAPSSPLESQPAARPVTVRLLYTADEHGWAQSFDADGKTHGGAAELLAKLEGDEGHCARSDCETSHTLLLSGGDNFTGPAISSYFRGESMARAMGKLGYFASAFGNHELDFGIEAFLGNRAASGMAYVSANLQLDPAADPRLEVPPVVFAHRAGVKIAVIGFTTTSLPHVANMKAFDGLALVPAEAAVQKAVEHANAEGADVRVLVAHECVEKLAPLVERHPEWDLHFVGAGHCHKPAQRLVGKTPVLTPGWRLQQYARVLVTVDLGRAPGDRVTDVVTEMVPTGRPKGHPRRADPKLAAEIRGYGERLDAALGERIGFTSRELGKTSAALATWITRAIRKELGADITIANAGGLRQAVPPGPITKKTIYSVLPFDNSIVLLSIKGADVHEHLAHAEAVFDGVRRRRGGGFELSSGRPIDPKRRYKVATIDFLYEGGDRFALRASDPAPRYTGIDWRTPVIDWTRRQRTSPNAPLDRLIDADASVGSGAGRPARAEPRGSPAAAPRD